MKNISKAVWVLSLVSLFTDMASEMLYPIMPIFLKSIGFSVVLIGVLEGVAEATAGLSKGYFGKLSDSMGKRVPFVRLGYGLSALSKPMMAAFVFPLWIFFARTIDRFGKGIRTGARDALLSDEATPTTKGEVFGFHRSMDTLGAVIGPFLALVFLYFYPEQYRVLFFLAFFPGILAVLATYFLKEKEQTVKVADKKGISILSIFSYWKTSPIQYKKITLGLLIFALVNSSDVFLLLKAKDAGLNDMQVIWVYIFYNLIYALTAFPLGKLADKIGLKPMFLFGLCIFALVYVGMAFSTNLLVIATLFLLYGIYGAATEGISKAWISNSIDKSETASAIGTYTGFQSLCALLASSLAGWLWFQFGAAATFFVTAFAAALLVFYFAFVLE